jgi:hypothetical protein
MDPAAQTNCSHLVTATHRCGLRGDASAQIRKLSFAATA